MKKLCILGLAAALAACNNDKMTEVLNLSNFFLGIEAVARYLELLGAS